MRMCGGPDLLRINAAFVMLWGQDVAFSCMFGGECMLYEIAATGDPAGSCR